MNIGFCIADKRRKDRPETRYTPRTASRAAARLLATRNPFHVDGVSEGQMFTDLDFPGWENTGGDWLKQFAEWRKRSIASLSKIRADRDLDPSRFVVINIEDNKHVIDRIRNLSPAALAWLRLFARGLHSKVAVTFHNNAVTPATGLACVAWDYPAERLLLTPESGPRQTGGKEWWQDSIERHARTLPEISRRVLWFVRPYLASGEFSEGTLRVQLLAAIRCNAEAVVIYGGVESDQDARNFDEALAWTLDALAPSWNWQAKFDDQQDQTPAKGGGAL